MATFGIPAAKSEPAIREDLAAACRIFASYGWANYLLANQHLSLRLPGATTSVVTFFINPPGVPFGDVTASVLVRVHVHVHPEGHVEVRGLASEDFLAAIDLHVQLHLRHATNDDLQCFFQAQTIPCAAVACMNCGVLPICQASCFALQGGAVGWPGVDIDECPISTTHRVVLSQAFGTLTAGRAAAEAFHYMFYTTSACEMQVGACAAQLRHLSFPPEAVAITHFATTMEPFQRQGLGHDIFEALRRSLPLNYRN
ncbi:hypothetical protein ACHHYP_08464 [Achlya hypogyna]|uniref:Class II aldolase/adducin N-terminal domain-containing protein n=1 Tax=Achlya hypogyna TaxID=1202772 RepID=A0A1V9YPB8_ACHHY|nr:hypothetical protein ACHHYP_08464 [Achlya hypogyna]